MRLKLTLNRAAEHAGDDLAVDIDASAPVSALAVALAERDPRRAYPGDPAGLTVRIDGPGLARTLAPDRPIGEAALRSGDAISLIPDAGRFVEGTDDRAAAATLVVEEGPDHGTRFPLRGGANQVGREAGNEVQLNDPMVSKRHARINVADRVEIIDLGSINGIEVGGSIVSRAVLRPGERLRIGDSVLSVKDHRPPASVDSGNTIPYNRSPYLDPRYAGVEVDSPEPPEVPRDPRLPWLAMLAPLLMGLVMFAVTQSLLSVVFVGLSPIMMAGSYLTTKHENKRARIEGAAAFREHLARFAAQLDHDRADEVVVRQHEHPSVLEVVTAAQDRDPLLWARRPDRPGFLELRLGVATQPTRSTVHVTKSRNGIPELVRELDETIAARASVSPVPVVATLPSAGPLGVAGPRPEALGSARALLAQLAGLHSPADLAIGALVPSELASDWDWLKWLPHTAADHSPLDVDLLGAGASSCGRLISALADLIAIRQGEKSTWPAVVVVVDDEAPAERSRLVDLAERGRGVGVHLVWVAASVPALPAACGTYLDCYPPPGSSVAGYLDGGLAVVPVTVEPLGAPEALAFARSLAPVVDAGANTDEASDVPARVAFLTEVGLDLAERAEAVVDRWRQSDSLPDPTGRVRRRRNQGLTAMVGAGANHPMQLDLRTHGPHALVGGTTGAGKSEFLQTWVIGLATNYSPNRVTFLFVDYKGGAAFSECVKLPHTVGLVTDLTPHLVRRALRSLNAELRHREHILNAKKAKDLLELESRGDPDTPPSLVIVVDEFAALATEVPEFVDGVVNVAQRGRSLGLHLILATQRPSGVIQGNLRANTNLRVALRMADEADSLDVIDEKTAATFDPALPGRGVAKIGPGRVHLFQTAYVGGWTTGEAAPMKIDISELTLGPGRTWDKPANDAQDLAELEASEADPGPTDLHRLVLSAVGASTAAGLAPPRKPWLPELADVYDLSRTPQSRTDTDLIFGIRDDPDAQAQVPVSFRPDVDGNMCVIGTGGSGKSGFLRTLAVAAGLTARGGPCHVYGLDFGARGLDMLEALPHVGSIINGDDDERLARLFRDLRRTIDDRAARFAAVRAGSIAEYRELANVPDEPRILVLLDGLGAFRSTYELSSQSYLFDQFLALAADGRQVGVHVVVSADRISTVPSSLGSVIQQRLVLRLADDNDYALAGMRADSFGTGAPPGRGFLGEAEVQIAVLGGTANTALQAKALTQLAAEMDRVLARPPAPPIKRLPTELGLDELPSDHEGRAPIGLSDRTMGPFAPALDLPLLIVGPPRSGKTTALETVATAVRRRDPATSLIYLGDGASGLPARLAWDQVLLTTELDFESELTALLEKVRAGALPPGSAAIFLDGADRLGANMAGQDINDLAVAASRSGLAVVADCETQQMSTGWTLLQSLKAARHGIALVPDQYDGDSVFSISFPRIQRKDYPPGRGIYVRDGKLERLQFAVVGGPG